VRPHGQPWPDDRSAAPSAAPGADAPIAVVELSHAGELPLQRTAAATHSALPSSPAAQLGQAVHRMLQWAAASNAAIDYDGWAVAVAAEFELPASAVTSVATIARAVRESAGVARFFDPGQVLWSAEEFDLQHQGQWLRLDRLVRLGPAERACWWVLDYKLAPDPAADAALREQLARYRAAVRHLVGGEPVRAAFVTAGGTLQELAESE
jgi:ATP-dependent helicase/nuclease subunit A